MAPIVYSMPRPDAALGRMKICMLMLARGFGGAERFYVDLSNGLARRGHEVMTISNVRSEAALRLEVRDNLHSDLVSVMGPWDRLATRKILKLLRNFAPDVIQTSLARAAHLAGPAARQLNIPLIAHTHDFVDLKYFRDVTVFAPTTRAQRDYLIQQGIAARQIELIPNFSGFSAVTQVRCKRKVMNIVTHGRFVPKKGFDLLLRSFSRITDTRIRLYIAGDGTERQRLVGLSTALKLGNRVSFVGWQDDIRSFLRRGDLFVLPSRYEPFGIAALEAMACGLPIVATKCHGPMEILNNDSAWLCDAEENALCGALSTAINDPDGRQQRAQQAWTAFRERYAADQALAAFENLYQSVC